MCSVVLSICRFSFVLYSAVSTVNSVHVVLSGLSMRLLYFNVCNCYRHDCMYVLAAFLLVCEDVMVMSYTYDVSCSGAGGCGMPDVYMLKSG